MSSHPFVKRSILWKTERLYGIQVSSVVFWIVHWEVSAAYCLWFICPQMFSCCLLRATIKKCLWCVSRALRWISDLMSFFYRGLCCCCSKSLFFSQSTTLGEIILVSGKQKFGLHLDGVQGSFCRTNYKGWGRDWFIETKSHEVRLNPTFDVCIHKRNL